MMPENLQINSAAITDKGLSEKRPQNEDSYLELRDSGLYAVADGVGGAQAGDVASQMAMEILGEAFINLQEDGDPEERMQAAIRQANSAIFQMSSELSQLSTMATTIVAMHVSGNIATIGHVGDSRLYRLDENGNLFRETQDHSVVEEEVRAGRMTPEQALTHPSRNVISRALGAEQTVEIDMKTIMFEPNTKFLICSDGVTRHIPDGEIASLLMNEVDNFLVCERIRELCYERGAEDNLTAVVVSATGAGEEVFSTTESSLPVYQEEETIATARAPLVNSAVFNTTQQNEEIPLEISAVGPDAEYAPETEDSENDHAGRNKISISTRDSEDDSIFSTYGGQSDPVERNKGGGIIGKIFAAILLLLIGGSLGAGGYYLWANSKLSVDRNAIPPLSTEQLLSFELKRRQVDSNPQSYLAQNVNPENPIDHYFLGRANYLNGNFVAAKKELEEAQNGMGAIDEVNRKVVENDIDGLLELINSKSGDIDQPASGTQTNQGAANKSLEKMPPAKGEPAVEPQANKSN